MSTYNFILCSTLNFFLDGRRGKRVELSDDEVKETGSTKRKRRRVKLPESDSSDDEGGHCYCFLASGIICQFRLPWQKYHRLGGLNNRNSFLTVLKAGKSKIKELAGSVLGRAPFLVFRRTPGSALSSCGRKRNLLCHVSIKALISSTRTLLS